MSRRRQTVRAACHAALLVLPACSDGVSADTGLEALLRVDDAQYFDGAMPAESGGPGVRAVRVADRARAGERDVVLVGALDATATSALVGLEGDLGYWVLPAGAPDVAAPGFPTILGALDVSTSLEDQVYTLRVQGADAAGRFGAPRLTALRGVSSALPDGELVVSLSWDTDADLDLHVVTPDEVEIFARNINSVEAPPPGQATAPDAYASGGILDFDSNAECVLDRRRRENVVYATPPPSGTFTVRVDTFSLCGAPAAHWNVDVVLRGNLIGGARGNSGPTDAEGTHDRGAGVLALTFDVP